MKGHEKKNGRRLLSAKPKERTENTLAVPLLTNQSTMETYCSRTSFAHHTSPYTQGCCKKVVAFIPHITQRS
jgi:hypothetical protein